MQAASLDVQLGSRSYPIHIGSGLLDDASLFGRHLGESRAVIVTNTTVAPLYLERLRAAIGERVMLVKVLPDGEEHKNLAVLSDLYDALLAARCDRNCTLVALGGGVIGDITGFAAATYQRGVSFLQVPTTLLAQVDSSVGGKTAVNHPRGKNMIGAFHQPRAVIADIDTLATLPPREYAAGLAEVLKYGLIGDAPFHAWLSANASAITARDAGCLIEIVRRSCANKRGRGDRHGHGGALLAGTRLAAGRGCPRHPRPRRGLRPARHAPGGARRRCAALADARRQEIERGPHPARVAAADR